MDLGKAVSEVLEFSLIGCLKDRTSLIYAGITFVIYSIFGIGMLVSISNLFTPLTTMGANANPQLVIGMLIGIYSMLAIYMIPLVLIFTLIGYLMIGRALKASKRKYMPLTVVRYIKYLFLPLVAGIIAGLSLYNIKWLWMLVVGLALILGGAVIAVMGNFLGGVLSAIGMLVLVLYFIVVLYNSLRLSIGEAIFVEGEGVINSLKKSWVITKGRVWTVVLISIILAIVLMVISMIFTIPSAAYSMMYMFSTIATVGTNPSTMPGIGYLSDPGYLIAILPSYLASAYAILVGSWFTVGLYNVLTKKGK